MRKLLGLALGAALCASGCGGDPCAAGKSVITGQLHPSCLVDDAASGGGGTGGAVLAAGSGNGSFTVPAGVSALQITARTTDTADVFAVYIGGRLTVNEVLDTDKPTFGGSYPVSTGAAVTVATPPSTRWSLSGVSLGSPGANAFTAAGSGDQAFSLPARTSRYRVTAQYTGTSQNFIFAVDGRTLVNVILGFAEGSTRYDNSFTLTGGTASIVSSTGVAWSVVETPP
jgi:hypothetical protein